MKWVDVFKTSGKRRSRLESVKLLLTTAATGECARRTNKRQRSLKCEDVVLMHLGIRRAYFNAQVDKDIFMEVPPEDASEGGSKQCGKLILCIV